MSRLSTLFSGRLGTKSGKGLVGVEIRVVDARAKQVLATSYSGEDGAFCVHLPAAQFDKRRKLTLVAMGPRGRPIAQSKGLDAAPLDTVRSDLLVSDAVAQRFKVTLPPIEKMRGSIIDPDAEQTIRSAIRMVAPAGSPYHNRYMNSMNCPLPPLAALDGLLEDAWEVLEGNPVVTDRFRQQLRLFDRSGRGSAEKSGIAEILLTRGDVNTSLPEGQGGTFGVMLMRAVFPQFVNNRIPNSILPHKPCALAPDRYIPVATAAIVSANSLSEAADQLGALERGLCGLGRYDLLLDAAQATLAGQGEGTFQGLLGFFGGECGPDDGPIPVLPDPPHPECPEPPGMPDLNPCKLIRLECLRELAEALSRRFAPSASPYAITAVTPANVCPGDTITLHGSGFGSIEGSVCFTNSSGGRTCVAAATWTDTQIVVVAAAGVGTITLKVIEEVIRACGRVITIYRSGTGIDFDGGAAEVVSLSVEGDATNVCASPNTDVDIRWAASSGSTVRIHVTRGTTTLLDQSGLSAIGSLVFHTPTTTSEQTLRVRAIATSRCGSSDRELNVRITQIPNLTIEGMEVTQAIQQFWRVGAIPNSVPTISNKDTIVRVYVSCNRNGFNGNRIDNVTGTLRVGGSTLTPINGITPNSPGGGNPFITARPRAEIDRTITNHTLNFRIPAALCTGTQTLRARIGVDICDRTVSVERNQNHTWQTSGALRVRFVRIRDDRTTGSGTRPSVAGAAYTVRRAFDLYPSPPTDIGAAWRATWNTTRAFNTDNGLRGLLDDLDDEHNCSAWEWLWEWTGATDCPDADNAEWVGLTDTRNRGWATGGNTCISAQYLEANGQGDLMRIKTSHELGHNLGFCHDNRGCGGSNPAGTCTTKGTLPDVGFDPYWNQTITDTNGVFDIMSYACTRWIDESTWQTLIDNI